MQPGVQTAAAAAAQLEVRQSRVAKETDLDFCALRNRMRTTTMLPWIQVCSVKSRQKTTKGKRQAEFGQLVKTVTTATLITARKKKKRAWHQHWGIHFILFWVHVLRERPALARRSRKGEEHHPFNHLIFRMIYLEHLSWTDGGELWVQGLIIYLQFNERVIKVWLTNHFLTTKKYNNTTACIIVRSVFNMEQHRM